MLKSRNLRKEIEKDINDILSFEKNHNNDAYASVNDNDAIIKLHLEKDNLYKPYSNNGLLNDEIFDYIYSAFKLVRKKRYLKLDISFSNDIDEQERAYIKTLIKKHYALEYQILKEKIKGKKRASFFCLVVGVLLLSLEILLYYFFKNQIVNEIIDIFSWVFIWEACDIFAFTITKYNINRIQTLRLFEMEIVDND